MNKLITVTLLFFTLQLSAQHWSGALGLGYANLSTSDTRTGTNPILTNNGVIFRAEAFYHPNEASPNLGVGLYFTSSALFDGNPKEGTVATALTNYGVKALYSFKTTGVSPFVGLGLGVATAQQAVLDEDDNFTGDNDVTVGLAVNPQVGLAFGRFEIAVDYQLPLQEYEFDFTNSTGKIAMLNFSLAYRIRE